MSERELTNEAQADRTDFNHELGKQGCSCCVSPPCSWCVHPGNPHNQEEDIHFKPKFDIMKSIREASTS